MHFSASVVFALSAGACAIAGSEAFQPPVAFSRAINTATTATSFRSPVGALHAASASKLLSDLEDLKNSSPEESIDDVNEDTKFLENVLSVLDQVDELQKSKDGLKDLRDNFLGAKSEDESEGGDAKPRRAVTMNIKPPSASSELAKTVARSEVIKKGSEVAEADAKNAATKETDDEEEENRGMLETIAGLSFLRFLIRLLLGQANGAPLKYARYGNHGEFPDYDLSTLPRMFEGAPQPQYIFSLRKFIRVIIRLLRANLALFITEGAMESAKTYVEKMEAFFSPERIFFGLCENPFKGMPRPTFCIENFNVDREFARQFWNGVNPVMIRVCSNPDEMLPADLVQFLKDQGKDPAAIAADKRLLYVTYDELAELEVNPHNAFPEPYNDKNRKYPRPYHPAIGVFEMAKDDITELDILAIRLESITDDDKAGIFSRDTCADDNEWFMAKTCLQNSDSQYHEWISHLGMTHLAFEPHIIAIHNTLKANNHKLYELVRPLTKDTLFLNWAARQSLAAFAPESFGDRVTSVGVGQYLQVLNAKWLTYDFFKGSSLDLELESRGFTADFECPGYLYRQDGMELWNAMGQFVSDSVDALYKSDAEVKADAGLQGWAEEVTNPNKGDIPGFPTEFEDKATLVKTVQTLMWMCSGLHAAVNYPQYDFLAYSPNKPLGQRRTMGQYLAAGSKTDDPQEWIFRYAMPLVDIAKEVALTVRLLTLPSRHCLDDMDYYFRKTPFRQAYRDFRDRCDTIGDGIETRNTRNRKANRAVYPYLNPSVVPFSIDI